MLEPKSGTTRLIPKEISEDTLKSDLEKYKQEVIEFGASRVEIIPAQWIQIDERVRLKCSVPRCRGYNLCSYCPPHTPEPEFMRQALSRFKWAILFAMDIPVEDFAERDRYYSHGRTHQKKGNEIAAKIELMAFADGYYLATAFGSGSCWSLLCDRTPCQVFDNGSCRFPLKARPSMEAVGIDVFGLVTKVGWDIYPIYNGVNPDLVPCAWSVGIVFIH